MKKAFGEELARARVEQGFPTAHAFYRSRDGRRHLGLSFANYLALEKGRSLPKPFRVKNILQALGLDAGAEATRRLVRAYLAAVLGSEELIALLAPAPDGGDAASPWKLAERAAGQALGERTVQLSLDQWKAMAASQASYDCHIVLVNTPGWMAKAEVARAAGLTQPEAEKALKALAAAGLVETEARRARTKLARKFLKPAPKVPAMAAVHAALYKYRRRWTEGEGRLVHLSHLTVRIPKKDVGAYQQHLARAVELSAVYGDVEHAPDTDIYLVEGRVYRIFP